MGVDHTHIGQLIESVFQLGANIFRHFGKAFVGCAAKDNSIRITLHDALKEFIVHEVALAIAISVTHNAVNFVVDLLVFGA